MEITLTVVPKDSGNGQVTGREARGRSELTKECEKRVGWLAGSREDLSTWRSG